jgi:acetoin utilization protein AcuB
VKVREVMSRDVLTVTGFTPLKEVARLLVERRISGLPVVEEGRLLGVVTDRDILDKLEPDPGSERQLLGGSCIRVGCEPGGRGGMRLSRPR